MPGPLSHATTHTPRRPPFWHRESRISPPPAYSRMLRATSEIAVAITVRSPEEKPSLEASVRPSWRALTMSAAEPMGTTRSGASLAMGDLSRPGVEVRESLLEVEGGRHVLQGQAELHHREGHLGLDADDDRLRSPELDHVGDRAQGAHREGVHHVEHRDVDDRALGAVLPDLLHQVVAQLEEILVGERRLDRGDQVIALLQDGNAHGALPLVEWALLGRLWGRPLPGHDDLVAQQPLRL